MAHSIFLRFICKPQVPSHHGNYCTSEEVTQKWFSSAEIPADCDSPAGQCVFATTDTQTVNLRDFERTHSLFSSALLFLYLNADSFDVVPNHSLYVHTRPNMLFTIITVCLFHLFNKASQLICLDSNEIKKRTNKDFCISLLLIFFTWEKVYYLVMYKTTYFQNRLASSHWIFWMFKQVSLKMDSSILVWFLSSLEHMRLSK